MSESEYSTALARRLTETDESVCASREVTSADEVAGLQSSVEVDGSEHWSESDLVLSYPIVVKRANGQWEPIVKSAKIIGNMDGSNIIGNDIYVLLKDSIV